MEALRAAAASNFAMSKSVCQHRLNLNSRSSLSTSSSKSLLSGLVSSNPSFSVRRASRHSSERKKSESGDLKDRKSKENSPSFRGSPSERRARSPTSPTNDQDPADFFEAVAEGDVDLVVEFIHKGFNVDSVDDEGNSALLFAAEGEPLIVEALLEAGCNINHQNANGVTALMRAIKCARARVPKVSLARKQSDAEMPACCLPFVQTRMRLS